MPSSFRPIEVLAKAPYLEFPRIGNFRRAMNWMYVGR